MNLKVYCPDIECDSCVRVISKALEKLEGIDSFKVHKDSVEVMYDGEAINKEVVLKAIKEKGYRVGLEPFERKSFRERFRDFKENKKKYELEYRMLKYSLFTLLLLVFLELIGYATFWNTAGFFSKYALWFLYLDLAVVSVGAAMLHLKSYRAKFTSMVGMMVGMTMGMQTGMMLGTIVGVTNGLFVGGLLGMILGVGVGFFNGKCCGVMGVMEGAMAGVMGGVMGSMIGTMFRVDHIMWFMPFFMSINVVILWGLSYMLFEEVVEGNELVKKVQVDFLTFSSYCILVVAVLILVMVYGFKTGLAVV